MLAAVLFDLDGTLLDIELDRFLREYFDLLGPVVGELAASSPHEALSAVMSGTRAMAAEHVGRTNRDVFVEAFKDLLGVDLASGEPADRLEQFYREEFPSLRSVHGPHEGGREVVSLAREMGLKTALATNPIFPYQAIAERMRWAELDAGSFDVVTSYESSMACKPHATYFVDVAAGLGVAPRDCLMVGDDVSLDLAAAATGMRTFYVGPGRSSADWTGSLHDLARLLPSLV